MRSAYAVSVCSKIGIFAVSQSRHDKPVQLDFATELGTECYSECLPWPAKCDELVWQLPSVLCPIYIGIVGSVLQLSMVAVTQSILI